MPGSAAPCQRRTRIRDLVYAAVPVDDVNLAVCVFTEAADGHARRQQQLRDPRPVALLPSAKNRATAEIAVEIDVVEARIFCAVIAIAAGDRACAAGVRILENREGEARILTIRCRVEAVRRFHATPAVILTADTCGRLKVDLFPQILTDIRDEQVSGVAIESESPRIAKSVRPDFRSRTGCVHEWI